MGAEVSGRLQASENSGQNPACETPPTGSGDCDEAERGLPKGEVGQEKINGNGVKVKKND